MCGLLTMLCIGFIIYQIWQSTDKEMFKAKYLNQFTKKDEPIRRTHRIDEILDKINKSGINSLSIEEKEFLDRFH